MTGEELHQLTVQDIERKVEDAVTITLRVPEESRADFRYAPGQYVMVRHPDDNGDDGFRSYSICQAPPPDGFAPAAIRIAVRLLGPGGFGEHAHLKLSVGDTVEVLRPTGRFRLEAAPRHLAVAAGSGITPILAMAEAALARGDRFGLIYGNRTVASTMFATEIAELESRFADRFTVVHVLTRADHGDPVRSGRIGPGNLASLLEAAGCTTADEELRYYLCGPAGMVNAVRAFLTTAGVGRRRIRSELFALPPAQQ